MTTLNSEMRESSAAAARRFTSEARSLRAQMEMTYAGTDYERGNNYQRHKIGPVIDLMDVSRRYDLLMCEYIHESHEALEGQVAWLDLALEIMATIVIDKSTLSSVDPYYALMLIRGVREIIDREREREQVQAMQEARS